MLDLTGGSVLSGLTKVKDSVLFDSLVSSECGVLKLWSSLEKKQTKNNNGYYGPINIKTFLS